MALYASLSQIEHTNCQTLTENVQNQVVSVRY